MEANNNGDNGDMDDGKSSFPMTDDEYTTSICLLFHTPTFCQPAALTSTLTYLTHTSNLPSFSLPVFHFISLFVLTLFIHTPLHCLSNCFPTQVLNGIDPGEDESTPTTMDSITTPSTTSSGFAIDPTSSPRTIEWKTPLSKVSTGTVFCSPSGAEHPSIQGAVSLVHCLRGCA